MSTTIDERVVEMRFDNQHFEKNVSSTMSLLDRFKQKLHLSGASKGLEDVNAATKKVDMSVLGRSVETVTAKFSALQVMGVTALANITNSAVNAGKNIVKSLTIDPIMSGFSEYETKMGSIQTILANTQHAGTTLEDVTAALEELNLYADKTIYNFQEMTRNIGTFTAAGVDLDTSVKSIQGIANLAAVSGSTSQQASTAMYQLSQALSSGTVKLMDWNSVVNAGMGGKVFQDALIRTAAMLAGQAKDVEAWKKANIDAHGSFRESLSEGWITSEVLTRTLEQFTMAAEEGTEEWENFKKSLMESGYTEAQAEEILTMANNASDAATKVKTFTQLLDTLKESAQSGWAQTWEILIGDIEEAKEFFGQLSDLFGGIIGRSADNRNKLLSEAFSSNWDKLINKLKEADVEATEFEERIRNILGDDALDGLIEKFGSLEKAVRAGAIPADVLKQALGGIAGSKAGDKIASFVAGLKEIERTLRRGHVGDDVKKLQTALDALGYSLGPPGIDGIIGPITEKAIKEFQKEHDLLVDGIAGPETLAALEKAGTTIGDTTEGVDGLTESYSELIDSITKKSGRELAIESLMNIIKAIHRPLAAVSEAFRNTFSIKPEQLYNALDKIHKVTSSWVMEGVLDATNWETLTRKVNDLGIETSVFEDKLTSMLKENGVNVDGLIEKYGSLGEAFDSGAITIDNVKEALLSFDGITESLLNGGEAADKVRRTFEGLFAIIEIIASIAGGAFKFAFKVLSKILGTFGYSLLDVTAGLGDALVAFRDWLFEGNIIAKLFDKLISKIPVVVDCIKEWFAAFKETPAVQKLADAIGSIADAFEKFFSGEIDSSELAKSLGAGLANALTSIPEIAIQVGKDFIAGFTDGIDFSISDVIGKIVSFCLDFVEAFKEALGVQSPSWKAYETVCDFFRGAINAVGDMLAPVLGVLSWIGEKIVMVFKSLWDYITDENGNLEWGKLFSAGILVSVAWFLKQLATAFSGIAGFLGGLDELIEGAGIVMKKFGKVLDGYAWDLKASALQKLAIAIAILVASIWVLTQIDDIGKLWNAVGVIAVLAAIVLGLAVAMDKLSGASATFDAKNKSLNIDGMKKGLLQIGIALLLLVASVKMIGSMDPGALKQGLLGLAGLAVGLIVFMAVLGGISQYSKDVDKFGSLILKLSIAMALLVWVVKLINGLSPEQMGKGAAFATGFAIFVSVLALTTKGAGKHVNKIGGMMIKLAIAMMLMVGVCKLAAGLSAKEMLKGAAFAAGFAIFVGILVACTKIGNDQKLAKIGGLVLSISFALLMMVGVCKLVGGLSVGEMLKGGAFIAGFAVLIYALVGVCKITNEQQMAKIGGAILAMAAAIAILAAVAVALSFVPVDGLAKGLAVVTVLSLLMMGMIKALKGAQNVKASLLTMTIAIGIMAAAIIGMSFIDPKDLVGPSIAMGVLMGMFALILKSSKTVTKSWGTIIAMTVAVAALAGVLLMVQGLNPLSAIGSATALGVLLVAMSAALGLLNGMNIKIGDAVKGVIALTLMAIPLLALVGVLAVMDGVEVAMTNVIALTALATALTLLLIPLTILGAIMSSGIGITPVVMGIGALTAMAIPLLAFIGILALMNGIENAAEKMTALADFMTVMGKLMVVLAVIGPFAAVGVSAMWSLVGLMAVIGVLAVALGALMEYCPSIQNFLDAGLPVLEGLATSLGTLIGNFIGAIGESLSGSFAVMCDDLSAAMESLKIASASAEGINGDAFNEVKKLTDVMGTIGWTTIGTSISDFLTIGGTSMEKFETDGVQFFKALKSFAEEATGIEVDEDAMDAVLQVATKLADLQGSLTSMGGVVGWFVSQTDLGTFGEKIVEFTGSMKTAMAGMVDFVFYPDKFESLMSAATQLATLQSSLEPMGGVVSWFAGRSDLGKFGEKVVEFVDSMKTAMASLSDFTYYPEAFQTIMSAATQLATLQSSLEAIGGVVDWFTGKDDLGTFGENVAEFIGSMKVGLGSIDGVTFDTEGLGTIIDAAIKLADLQSHLESVGGVVDWFTGRDDLGTFGTNVGKFAEAMGKLKTEMGEDGIGQDVIDSVKNSGLALIELEKSMPDKGWFSSKLDLGTFSGYVTDFAAAIGAFGESSANIKIDAINNAISTANQIIKLCDDMAYVNVGMLNHLVGSSSEGTTSSSPMAELANGIVYFSQLVEGINIEAVRTSANAASTIVGIIGALKNIDTSAVEKFKPELIGAAMQAYSDAVSNYDPDKVTNSISEAYRLKTFIEKLVDLDNSGVYKFNSASSIGAAIQSYSNAVSEFNVGQVSDSISKANDLKTFISGLSGLNTTGVSSFVSAIDDLSTAKVADFTEAFSGLSDDLSTSAATAMSGFISGIESKLPDVTTAAESIITNLTAGISDNSGDVATAATACAEAAASAIKECYTSFYNAGSYLVSGFAAGITASTWKAEAKARLMAQAAEEAARDELDINSPSKVFRALGYSVPEGFAMGIDKMSRLVTASSKNMADTSISGVKGAIARIADIASGDIDTQPTIRPVLDLSDIRAGAGSINSLLGGRSSVGVLANVGAISGMMNRRGQNGVNSELISAIDGLRKDLGNVGNTTYSINGITYDDGSNISETIKALVRQAKIERRV